MTTPAEPGPPLAVVAVPAGAAASTRRVPRVFALVFALLAVGCLPVVVIALAVGEPAYVALAFLGFAFWTLLGFLAWVWGRRGARAAPVDGAVLVAVHRDGVAVGDGRGPAGFWPWSALSGIDLHWFSLGAPPALNAGSAAARGLVEAAYAGAGGNLGLAVVLIPADGTPPVVGRAHRLVADGDPAALALAIHEVAGVPVRGATGPPPDPPPLPDQLRG